MPEIKLVFGLLLSLLMMRHGYCVAGTFDSSNIRSIKTEVNRIKDMSETIVNEIKKQKEVTTALQNEFKVFNADIKWIKKALSDLDTFLNKTIANDTQFIKEKISDCGPIPITQAKPVNQKSSSQKETSSSQPNSIAPNDINQKLGDPKKGAGSSSANKESGTSTSTTTTTTTEISKMLKLFQG